MENSFVNQEGEGNVLFQVDELDFTEIGNLLLSSKVSKRNGFRPIGFMKRTFSDYFHLKRNLDEFDGSDTSLIDVKSNKLGGNTNDTDIYCDIARLCTCPEVPITTNNTIAQSECVLHISEPTSNQISTLSINRLGSDSIYCLLLLGIFLGFFLRSLSERFTKWNTQRINNFIESILNRYEKHVEFKEFSVVVKNIHKDIQDVIRYKGKNYDKIGILYHLLAKAYLGMNEFEKAEKYLKEAREQCFRGPNYNDAEFEEDFGRVNHCLGNHKAALSHYLAALSSIVTTWRQNLVSSSTYVFQPQSNEKGSAWVWSPVRTAISKDNLRTANEQISILKDYNLEKKTNMPTSDNGNSDLDSPVSVCDDRIHSYSPLSPCFSEYSHYNSDSIYQSNFSHEVTSLYELTIQELAKDNLSQLNQVPKRKKNHLINEFDMEVPKIEDLGSFSDPLCNDLADFLKSTQEVERICQFDDIDRAVVPCTGEVGRLHRLIGNVLESMGYVEAANDFYQVEEIINKNLTVN